MDQDGPIQDNHRQSLEPAQESGPNNDLSTLDMGSATADMQRAAEAIKVEPGTLFGVVGRSLRGMKARGANLAGAVVQLSPEEEARRLGDLLLHASKRTIILATDGLLYSSGTVFHDIDFLNQLIHERMRKHSKVYAGDTDAEGVAHQAEPASLFEEALDTFEPEAAKQVADSEVDLASQKETAEAMSYEEQQLFDSSALRYLVTQQILVELGLVARPDEGSPYFECRTRLTDGPLTVLQYLEKVLAQARPLFEAGEVAVVEDLLTDYFASLPPDYQSLLGPAIDALIEDKLYPAHELLDTALAQQACHFLFDYPEAELAARGLLSNAARVYPAFTELLGDRGSILRQVLLEWVQVSPLAQPTPVAAVAAQAGLSGVRAGTFIQRLDDEVSYLTGQGELYNRLGGIESEVVEDDPATSASLLTELVMEFLQSGKARPLMGALKAVSTNQDSSSGIKVLEQALSLAEQSAESAEPVLAARFDLLSVGHQVLLTADPKVALAFRSTLGTYTDLRRALMKGGDPAQDPLMRLRLEWCAASSTVGGDEVLELLHAEFAAE